MNRTFSRFAVSAQIVGLTLIFAFFATSVAVSAASAAAVRVKIEIQSAAAVSDGQNGALIEWQSSFEIGNLGYNVYRLENGKRIKVNQGLVPGSAFIVGEMQPLYGNKCSFFDEQGAPDSQYLIEALMLNGKSQSFTVQTSYDSEMLARSGREAKSNEGLSASAEATAELFGQRQYPQTIRTGAGRLSPNPLIQSDSVQQRWVAAQPGLKFAIKTNGLFRITRQQLLDNGFDVSVPTANWQLYTDGVEQAMLLTGDNNGGVLNANGYLEFYGFGVNKSYTDTQTFYLVVGTSAGKRMVTSSRRGGSIKIAAPSFQSVAQCRTSVAAQCNKPIEYTSDIRNGEAENFFGDVIYTTPVNLTISTPAVDMNAGGTMIDVSIQGFSTNPPTHNIEVSLNGTVIGNVAGGGRDLMRSSFNVPAGLLLEGNNTVRLNSTVSFSVTLVDYVRIRYARRYSTADNKLLLTTASNRAARVDGFTDTSVRFFDVTDQNNVSVANRSLIGNGTNFTAVISTLTPRMMYAVTDGAVSTPASITQNIPSTLYDTALNKDLLIVTYKDWQTQAGALAAYRQGQGLNTAVVDIEDVFDEFSFGASTPAALHDFFQRAAPRYALLMGDATQDPRNYLSTSPNFLPTNIIDSNYGEIASDELMGDFTVATGQTSCPQSLTGDCVSDFPIGRISVRNAAQAQTVVSKIMSFEQTVAAGQAFSRGVYFINDYVNGYDFAASNQALATRLPQNTPVQVTGAIANPTSTQLAQTQDEIIARMNAGPFIVGYAGHGANTSWSFPNIFLQSRAQTLTNSDRLSLFLLLTCLNGAFADFRNDPSLAENLIRAPNGGAIAVWASSALTVAPGQDIMANHFYDLHRQASPGARIGDLIKESKLETSDNDVRASWILFGDPTLKIK